MPKKGDLADQGGDPKSILDISHSDGALVFHIDGFESRRARAAPAPGEKAGRSQRKDPKGVAAFAGPEISAQALYAVRWVQAGPVPDPRS